MSSSIFIFFQLVPHDLKIFKDYKVFIVRMGKLQYSLCCYENVYGMMLPIHEICIVYDKEIFESYDISDIINFYFVCVEGIQT